MIQSYKITSISIQNNIKKNTEKARKSMLQLSTGFRINSAADDAAGLAISEKMRGQIRGLNQASNNVQDGISLIQTADGALGETNNILNKMRELSVQYRNGTYSQTEKEAVKEQFDSLRDELTKIKDNTQFNGKNILKDKLDITLQTGANSSDNLRLEVDAIDFSNFDITNGDVIQSIDNTIDNVLKARGKLGAYQNRLEYTSNRLGTASENLTAAESRIRDTDMAAAMSDYVKNDIMQKTSIALFSQAQSNAKSILKLLDN